MRSGNETSDMGAWGPHITRNMGTGVPISLGIWGLGSPNWGSPFHADTVHMAAALAG